MDEKQLQALYNAMHSSLDLGDYGTFKNTIVSDTKYRKAIYDQASHELDLGDYNTWNKNIGFDSKEVQQAADPNATLKLSEIKSNGKPAKLNVEIDINALNSKQGGSLSPTPQDKKIAEETASKMNEQVAIRNEAIDNTLQRNYDFNKQKVNKNSVQYKKDFDALLQKQTTGESIIAKAKDGKPFVVRGRGFIESAGHSLVESFKAPVEAWKILNLEGKDLADYLDRKAAEEPYLPESKVSGVAGAFGEAAGGFPKIGGLFAINTLAPGFGTVLAAAEAEFSSTGAHTEQLYHMRLKELTDKGVQLEEARLQAADAAKKDAPLAAAPDAIMTAALGEMGGNPKALTTAAQTFRQTLVKSGESVGKFGIMGGISEVGRTGVEKAQGYDATLNDAMKSFGEGAFQWATMDAMFKLIPVITKMPGAAQAAWKEYMAQVPKPIMDEAISNMGEVGQALQNDLNNYQEARKTVEGVVPEEDISHYAGLVEKQNNIKVEIADLEEKKKFAPEGLHASIDENIKNLNKEISVIDDRMSEMQKSDKPPIEHEVDPLENDKIIKVKDVHKSAEKADIDINTDEFKSISKELTKTEDSEGQSHLDDMTPEQLTKINDYINETKEEAKKPVIKAVEGSIADNGNVKTEESSTSKEVVGETIRAAGEGEKVNNGSDVLRKAISDKEAIYGKEKSGNLITDREDAKALIKKRTTEKFDINSKEQLAKELGLPVTYFDDISFKEWSEINPANIKGGITTGDEYKDAINNLKEKYKSDIDAYKELSKPTEQKQSVLTAGENKKGDEVIPSIENKKLDEVVNGTLKLIDDGKITSEKAIENLEKDKAGFIELRDNNLKRLNDKNSGLSDYGREEAKKNADEYQKAIDECDYVIEKLSKKLTEVTKHPEILKLEKERDSKIDTALPFIEDEMALKKVYKADQKVRGKKVNITVGIEQAQIKKGQKILERILKDCL